MPAPLPDIFSKLLPEVQAAAARATPDDLDRALLRATYHRIDDVFDFLLTCAPQRPDAIEYALNSAAADGYLHALRALLPRAQHVPQLAGRAMRHCQDEAALLIIAASPGSFRDATHAREASCLRLALLHCGPEVARVLIPLTPAPELQTMLFSIAGRRSEVVADLAAAVGDVMPVIARLLDPRMPREAGAPSSPSLRGADELLAFLPPARRLEVIEANPVLRAHPVAAATLHQARLEVEVSPVVARPLPRL